MISSLELSQDLLTPQCAENNRRLKHEVDYILDNLILDNGQIWQHGHSKPVSVFDRDILKVSVGPLWRSASYVGFVLLHGRYPGHQLTIGAKADHFDSGNLKMLQPFWNPFIERKKFNQSLLTPGHIDWGQPKCSPSSRRRTIRWKEGDYVYFDGTPVKPSSKSTPSEDGSHLELRYTIKKVPFIDGSVCDFDFYLQQLVWFDRKGSWPQGPILFRDGNRTNCKPSNLYSVTPDGEISC